MLNQMPQCHCSMRLKGDGLSTHAGMAFSTWDVDNDQWGDGSCARDHQGAWWYNQCGSSSLNGDYLQVTILS